MEGLKELFEIIDKMHSHKTMMKEFAESNNLTFYRHRTGYYKGKTSWSTWKILLDQSETVMCVRDRRGFKTIPKSDVASHIVLAPEGVKAMLLSKDKKDWLVADEILEGLVKKKYDKEGH